MSEIGEKLKELRKRRGLSQKKLAEISGVQRTYISLLESRQRKGRISWMTATALAKALEVNPEVFFEMAHVELPEKPFRLILREVAERYDAMQLVELPVRGCIPAGYPLPEEEQEGGVVEVPQGLLGASAGRKDLYALKVMGESLAGDGIHSGDFLVVEPGSDLADGKIYVVRLGNEVVARHVEQMEGKVRLSSSSGEFKDLEPSEVEILGRIIVSGRWRRH